MAAKPKKSGSPEAKTMGETFSEINDQSEDGYGHAGENYHGEWY